MIWPRRRQSSDSLYQLAQELDPARKGIHVSELRDAAVARGLLTGNSDPYRHVYSLLGYAKHRFARIGKATFRWQETDLRSTEGLGGRNLVNAALAWAREQDPENEGVHYQRVVAGLSAAGTPVKGPDPGRTLYSNLIGSVGLRSFERTGAGIFRRRIGGQ